MKKELKGEEAVALAERLNLTTYINTVGLIESLHIEKNKELNVCIVSSDRHASEYIFKTLTGFEIHIGYDTCLRAEITYGMPAYEITTEYGELSVDENQIREIIAHKNTVCHVSSENDILKNLKITFIFVPEYDSIDEDMWRCLLLEADKLVMVLNANQILPQTEQRFIKAQVLPIFSNNRLMFGIGNAQYMRIEEWKEGIERTRRLIGDCYSVFPIFTENVPEEFCANYLGSEITIETELEQTGKNIIDLRRKHFEDLERYKINLLEEGLRDLRKNLEVYKTAGKDDIETAKLDIEKLSQSKKHIEGYIDLFFQTPLVSRYHEDVEDFAARLTKSLQEDIAQSENIKQDAKALPRYLTYIWDKFTEDQNSIMSRLFEKETATIVEMMNLDLKKIVRDINHIQLASELKEHAEESYNVHTFFSRKTTAGNGLTDAMTIGGIITTIFVTPLGLGAVLGSELIKILGKDKFDNDYKEELSKKIGTVIERNMKELIAQADGNFKKVSDIYRKEILHYYDETIDNVKAFLSKEEEKVDSANETIKTIDTLI